MIRNILCYAEESARRFPGKTAFADEETACTYDELIKSARAVGTRLGREVTPGKPVPVLMEKGVKAIYAFMGIVSAGCFYILLDPKLPTERLRSALEEKYAAPVYPVNCEQLKEDDIYEMMRQVLYEFPVTEIEFYIPKWVEMLSCDHRIKKDLIENVKKIMAQMSDLRSVSGKDWKTESPYIDQILLDQVEMDTGKVILRISFCQKYYYEVLSELTGTQIRSEYELISLMKELSSIKEEFSQIKDAFADVKMKGYGVVSPKKEEIHLDEPVIIKQGSRSVPRHHRSI